MNGGQRLALPPCVRPWPRHGRRWSIAGWVLRSVGSIGRCPPCRAQASSESTLFGNNGMGDMRSP